MAGESSPVDQVIQEFDAARVSDAARSQGATSAPPLSVVHIETPPDERPPAILPSLTHPVSAAPSLDDWTTIITTSSPPPTGGTGAPTVINTTIAPTLAEIEALLDKEFGSDWQASLVAQARTAISDDLALLRDQIQTDVKTDAPQIIKYGAFAVLALVGVGVLVLIYLLEQAISGHNSVAESYVAALGTRLNSLPLPAIIGGLGLLLFPSPLGSVVKTPPAAPQTVVVQPPAKP